MHAEEAALIDTNVSLSRWPIRRCPLDDTPALVTKLREHGVTQAWAGTFDALLHKDLATANARLADECARQAANIIIAKVARLLATKFARGAMRKCSIHWACRPMT